MPLAEQIYKKSQKLEYDWPANINGKIGKLFFKGRHAIEVGEYPLNPYDIRLAFGEIILGQHRGTTLEEIARISLETGIVDVKKGKEKKVLKILKSLDQTVVNASASSNR